MPQKKLSKAIERLEKLQALALRRGFFWPQAELYGGKAGFYGYGHLGKALKEKFEKEWRKHFLKENCYEIESSTILPEEVFKASGHVEHFKELLIECKTCHFRFRADQFLKDQLKFKLTEINKLTPEDIEQIIKEKGLKCPKCGSWHLSAPRFFELMFPISIGAAGTKELAYLVPETAQTAYLAFKREFETTRKKLPLGIAIIGKAFRNELSPRQMFFRLREFNQAELQIFFNPSNLDQLANWNEISSYKLRVSLAGDEKIREMCLKDLKEKINLPKLYLWALYEVQDFYLNRLKIPKKAFRLRELSKEEAAFYNKLHWDIELALESLGGFEEVGGVHYRGDYDLARHEKASRQSLHVFYQNERFIPHVLELSFGIDRNLWALLDLFYKEEKERTLLKFPPHLAPTQVAVFPLVAKAGLPEKANEIYKMLKEHFTCFYDEADSIGRRYRRQDEIGTPYCVTIDGQTLRDDTVTLRERDSMKQKRIKVEKLYEELKEALR